MNLEDGRAGKDVVVGDRGNATADEESVGLTANTSGDDSLDSLATVCNGGVGEDGAGDCGEGDLELTLEGAGCNGEGDGGAGGDYCGGLSVVGGAVGSSGRAGQRKGGESLDGKGGVALGARLDEKSSQGVNLVEVERSVEGRGEGREGALGCGAGTDI